MNTMMEYVTPFLFLLNTMAPYLLLGFLLAGVIHAYVPRRLYARYLSKPDFRSVVLAALFGVPLPLCSCGVIPTAMSLRREGASKGAVASFLIATPQTGVDSIVATASVLGIPFAVIRPLAAFVTALAGGWAVNRLTRNETDGVHAPAEDTETPMRGGRRAVEALRYGFIDMMQDIGRWLVLGLLVAGLITILVPDDFFASFADRPLLNMFVVLLFSIPMYLCATGSIPIAAALMLKGLTPGAALVLLMAGPATNMASILVIGKVMGRRTLMAYLASIIIGAIGFGLVIDYLLPAAWFVPSASVHAACHGQGGYSWLEIASSVVLVALLIYALVRRYTSKTTKNMTKQIYRVGGMSCNHCKASVEKNLAKLPAVTSVEVDLAAGTAAVEGTVNDDDVRRVIEELGFEYGGRI